MKTKKELYQEYIESWCKERGFEKEAVMEAAEKNEEYNGQMFACYNEWLDCEYSEMLEKASSVEMKDDVYSTVEKAVVEWVGIHYGEDPDDACYNLEELSKVAADAALSCLKEKSDEAHLTVAYENSIIYAYKNTDPDYPGFTITLQSDESQPEVDLLYVEGHPCLEEINCYSYEDICQ